MNKGNLLLGTLLLSSFIITSCGTSNKEEVPQEETPTTKTIDIYGINDFHGAFTYDKETKQTGLSRIGNYLIEQKKKNPDTTFIVSQGDMWQGGVESNKTQGKIVTEAMNIIGFDAMAIGNHEFDWGEEAIKANKELMKFPLLSSNIFYSKDHSRPSYLTPSTIINRGGLKIGFIGAGSHSLGSDIIGSVSKNFVFEEPVNHIKEESKKLKSEGCDAIILLTHDGGEEGPIFEYTPLTNVDEPFVDTIFLGHDHYKKSGSTNGVPYIEGGSNGKYLSHIQLEIEKNKEKTSVNSKKVEHIYTFEVTGFKTPNKDIDKLLDKYKDDIGDIDRVIYNFTRSLSRNEFLDIICKAMYEYLDNKKQEYNYDIKASFHNAGGVRSDVLAGEFTYRDLIKVCPFTNTLVVMKVDRATYGSLSKNGNYIPQELSFTNGYEYVVAISFVAENSYYDKVEKHDTGIIIQDAVEYYLSKHPGEY